MALLMVLLVTLLQSLATIVLYGSGIIRTFGLREGIAETALVLPSVVAFIVNSLVLFVSPLFRTHRVGSRLALVLGCAAVPTIVAFAAAMIVGLNKWGS
jgi:hypothetical protein